jgi:hypothetical protein
MPEVNKTEELKYSSSTGVNKNGQPVLGTLEGPVADIINPTRNGRKYSENLWEKVFNSDIVKEQFESGGILGELDHPTDRTELCTEKVAICMPEPPVKKDGKLWGKFDILDTPNGRIVATLAKYGYKLGISSRGSGDTFTDYDGQESVDPDSYSFTCFDVVIVPAVKAARLAFSESLDNSQNNFRKAINEALNRSSDDDKKIMMETLQNLNIDYKESPKTEESEPDAVRNSEAELLRSLQETLSENKALKSQLLSIQEKLSVSYAKEMSLKDTVSNRDSQIKKLVESANKRNIIENRVKLLESKLEMARSTNKSNLDTITSLKEQLRRYKQSSKTLTENLSEQEDSLKSLKEQITKKDQDIKTLRHSMAQKESQLKESYEELRKDFNIKKDLHNKELEERNKLVEHYQKVARSAVNRYIDLQAKKIGVSSNEISSKLPKTYSFSDIDSICEDLQNYKVALSRLPIALTEKKDSIKKIDFKESKEPILPNLNLDDEVDEQLKNLINN